jgi:hypothetical protein
LTRSQALAHGLTAPTIPDSNEADTEYRHRKDLMNTKRTNTRGTPSDTILRVEHDMPTTCLGSMPQQSGLQRSRIRPVAKQSATTISDLCDD